MLRKETQELSLFQAVLELSLYEAVKANQYELAEACLSKGAKGIVIEGDSPLHHAVEKKNIEMIKLLLKFKADASIKNANNLTPIQFAADQNYWDGVLCFANTLKDSTGSYNFGSAMYSVMKNKNIKPNQKYVIVKALLKAGADVRWVGRNDHNGVLHEAVLSNSPELVALLLSYGANPHTANTKKVTPIRLAINLNYHDCNLAFVKPEKYLKNEISSTHLRIFHLLSIMKKVESSHPLPNDCLKIIMDYAFNDGRKLIYRVNKDDTQPDTFSIVNKTYNNWKFKPLLKKTSQFINAYFVFSFIREKMNAQSPESVVFANSLKEICASSDDITDKANKIELKIRDFVKKKGNVPSRAISLLTQYRLFTAPSSVEEEKPLSSGVGPGNK